jgi:hypothetical protein
MVVSFARLSRLTRYRREIVSSRRRRQFIEIIACTLGDRSMAVTAIHVVPDDNFDDWSFVTTRGTSSVTIQPGKTPNLRRNQLGGSWKPGSSSIS